MKYTVVVEMTSNNYAAYVPDLPGCVATARTRKEVLKEVREAIGFHIEGMCEDGGSHTGAPDYGGSGGCCRDGSRVSRGHRGQRMKTARMCNWR